MAHGEYGVACRLVKTLDCFSESTHGLAMVTLRRLDVFLSRVMIAGRGDVESRQRQEPVCQKRVGDGLLGNDSLPDLLEGGACGDGAIGCCAPLDGELQVLRIG